MAHASRLTPAQVLANRPSLGALAPRIALGAGLTGLGGLVVSLVIGAALGDGLRRFYFGYLVAFMYVASLGLGALFFVIVQYLARASWSVVVRRVAELVAAALPILAVLALPIVVPMLSGSSQLYWWVDPAIRAHDPLIHSKASYLNPGFFALRLVLYFAIWTWLSRRFLGNSVQQDQTGEPDLTRSLWRFSAPAMALFALTTTFFAIDLLMGLDAHWYSTIFGVYYFSGAIVGTLSLLILLLIIFQRSGVMRGIVTVEHFHDLGKLLFAFVFFWGYIAFSQFMLYWYANIPEETQWYAKRGEGGWMALSLLLLFGHLLIPFAGLVGRWAKRRKRFLGFWAAWMLVMHYFDLYWLIMPEYKTGVVPWHVIDLTCLIGVGGLFIALAAWLASSRALVPLRDPALAESLRFENV